MIADPKKMTFLLPRISPTKMVKTAPTKQPRVYEAIVIPLILERYDASGRAGLVSTSGNMARNEGRVKRPPITP
jgi:hypothetical protein